MAANTGPKEIRHLKARLAVARRWRNEDADVLQLQLNEKLLEQQILRLGPQLRNDQRVRLAKLLVEAEDF